jgi:hypothetical protein
MTYFLFSFALLFANPAMENAEYELYALHTQKGRFSKEMLELITSCRSKGVQFHLRAAEYPGNKPLIELTKPVAFPCVIVYSRLKKELPDKADKDKASKADPPQRAHIEIAGTRYVEEARKVCKELSDLQELLNKYGNPRNSGEVPAK